MTEFEIIEQIAGTPSRKQKEAILREHIKDNLLLQCILISALDSRITFGIKGRFVKSKFESSVPFTFDTLKVLTALKNRTVTGFAANRLCQDTVDLLSLSDAELFNRILNKDLRAGITATTVNKVSPGLIFQFQVMKANDDTSGIVYPAISEVKIDGARCQAFIDVLGNVAYFLSSDGKQIDLCLTSIPTTIKNLAIGVCGFFDGELVAIENGKFLKREVSNGLVNKAIKGTIGAVDAYKLFYVIWDFVEAEHPNKKYVDRRLTPSSQMIADRNKLLKLEIKTINDTPFVCVNHRILINVSKEIANEQEGLQFFKEVLSKGLEGTIEKNKDHIYEAKRTKNLGKRKLILECDLIIVGYNPGSGKFLNQVGSVILESSDGLLRVDASGFDDQTRLEITRNQNELINKIVTVKFNELVSSDKSEKFSLFLPRFKSSSIRFDKDTANSLEEIITIWKQSANRSETK